VDLTSYLPRNLAHVIGRLWGWLGAVPGRFHVANNGRVSADRVRVSLLQVERWDDESGWEHAQPEIDGADLVWSNRSVEPLDIPPGV
jgi:hypothetical protein